MTAQREGSQPSTRSLRGLDAINVLMADVRDGVGPYLAMFLTGGEHWDTGAIGVAMAASSVAAAVFQVPAGLLVDGTRWKRLLIACDLTRGTGRFNFAQGLMALSVGIGATLSNATAGYAVQWFGFTAGFPYLAGIASAGLAFFAVLMPETAGRQAKVPA